MKTKFRLTAMAILLTFIYAGIAFAGDKEKIVIGLKTNDFEVAETDISNLTIGESETIVTESGKIIDLMRTADGVEVYVDGELMDMPHLAEMAADGSGHHKMHERVVIECEVDEADDVATECGDLWRQSESWRRICGGPQLLLSSTFRRRLATVVHGCREI